MVTLKIWFIQRVRKDSLLYSVVRNIYHFFKKIFSNEYIWAKWTKFIIQKILIFNYKIGSLFTLNSREKYVKNYIKRGDTIYIISTPVTFTARIVSSYLSYLGIKNKILKLSYDPGKFAKQLKKLDDKKVYLFFGYNVFYICKKHYIYFNLDYFNNSNILNSFKYNELVYKASFIFTYNKKEVPLFNKKFKRRFIFFKCFGIENLSSNARKNNSKLFFYGYLSKRRKRIIKWIKRRYSIASNNAIFGKKLAKCLNTSFIVINLHAYDNATLETNRICEAVSHGCFVVSEDSKDSLEYPELLPFIEYFSNKKQLTKILDYYLKNKDNLKRKSLKIKKLLEKYKNTDALIINNESLYGNGFINQNLYRYNCRKINKKIPKQNNIVSI